MFNKINSSTKFQVGGSVIVGGIIFLTSSNLVPITSWVLSAALGNTTGLAITGSIGVITALSTFGYCYKNSISFKEFKAFVVSPFRNLICTLTTFAVLKAVKENADAVDKVIGTAKAIAGDNSAVATNLGTITGSLGGFAVGYAAECLASDYKIKDTKGIRQGAEISTSAMIAFATGGNPVMSVLTTQIGSLIGECTGFKTAGIIGTVGMARCTGTMTALADRMPWNEVTSNTSTAVFVGTGTGKVVEALLKHLEIENPGQIKDGFSIMMTSAVASGLGANPYGAVFGLTLSKATGDGVARLAVIAKLPEQAKAIGDIASTIATPMLGITTEAALKYLSIPTSGALETVSYGVGTMAEGYFSGTGFAKELGIGVSALTSCAGSAITGDNTTALVLGAFLGNLVKTGAKKVAKAAKCEEQNAEAIGTAVGAVALPAVGVAASTMAADYPRQAMLGIAVAGLYMAYKHDVHGCVAKQAGEIACAAVVEIGSQIINQSIEQGFLPKSGSGYKYGTVENAYRVQQERSVQLNSELKVTQAKIEQGINIKPLSFSLTQGLAQLKNFRSPYAPAQRSIPSRYVTRHMPAIQVPKFSNFGPKF